MTHNWKQTLTFLKYINNVINDPFIRLEIRQKIKGHELMFKKFLSNIHTPNINKQDGYDLLHTYSVLYNYDTQNVKNALKDQPKINPFDYIESLNNHLDILSVPTRSFGIDPESQ